MGIYGKKSTSIDAGENIFWTTMADLLLGLAIIFMTLFVLAMTGFTQETIKLQQNQMKAAEELVDNLKQANIDAEVDKLTGNVKISDLQLFEVNSFTLFTKRKRVFKQIYTDIFGYNLQKRRFSKRDYKHSYTGAHGFTVFCGAQNQR